MRRAEARHEVVSRLAQRGGIGYIDRVVNYGAWEPGRSGSARDESEYRARPGVEAGKRFADARRSAGDDDAWRARSGRYFAFLTMSMT
jgi:hypothetical protein